MRTYYAFRTLCGLDENCTDYIDFASNYVVQAAAPQVAAPAAAEADGSALQRAIVKGLKDKALELTAALVEATPPLDVVQQEIIPALDTVGKGFEEKKVYLPQLLMSAEAAKSAFVVIKEKLSGQDSGGTAKCPFVIATVRGDIHDIGKNIVRLLLENYGFAVTDLGKDVEAERIVEAAVKLHAPLVGLSALMTTTVPAMEETIRLLRKTAPWCRVMVGGAVLNPEYAAAIGADFYAKDAMEAVRCADQIYEHLFA